MPNDPLSPQDLFAQLAQQQAAVAAVVGVPLGPPDPLAATAPVLPVDERIAAAVAPLAQTLATKANASSVGALSTRLGAAETALAGKVERAGDTMTGALNVLPPAKDSNPVQLSNLPLSMTITQALPALALGGAYAFTVAVAGAVVGQVVVLNVQATLLSKLSFYAAAVSAPGVVTVQLTAGLAIAAGSQTFYLRVLR